MSEFTDMIAGKKPTVVDFFATWCGPCRVQGPILEQVKSAVGDDANVIKVDIDKNQELAAKYNVRSVPTLMVFKNGELLWRESGYRPAAELMTVLAQYY